MLPSFNYPYDPLIISNHLVYRESVVSIEFQLTFRASYILIISKVENSQIHSKTPFCRTFCKRTEGLMKDRTKNSISSILVLWFRVWTRIYGSSVLEIIRTQNEHFYAYVELEEEKKTRWHTRRARMRNAMRSITSFSIIKSRKLGENCFSHRVRNSFLGGIFLIFAWIENRFFCYAKEEC